MGMVVNLNELLQTTRSIDNLSYMGFSFVRVQNGCFFFSAACIFAKFMIQNSVFLFGMYVYARASAHSCA